MIGAIGSRRFGDVIIFEVSDEKILTFSDFNRKSSVRFAKNDILLRKPVSQFTGPDLGTVSFKLELRAQYGVNPKTEMEKLIALHQRGAVVTVVIGKTILGMCRWRIADLNMTWRNIDNKGNLISAVCDISFEEYA